MSFNSAELLALRIRASESSSTPGGVPVDTTSFILFCAAKAGLLAAARVSSFAASAVLIPNTSPFSFNQAVTASSDISIS
jgi:hypothetical protein